MINVTLIYADGSPCTYQCTDNKECILRTAEYIRLGGTNPLYREVHTVYVFDTERQELVQYSPESVFFRMYDLKREQTEGSSLG